MLRSSQNESDLLLNKAKNLTHCPGVYQYYDAAGVLLYVGKAKNLQKRVLSYFRGNTRSIKTLKLVEKIKKIEVVITESELEALLLESNLIKKHKPRYNVLLKDDKSYPYIFISTAETYPRMVIHRGVQHEQGSYFGPFPNARAARHTLDLLQKIFRLRSCRNSFFKARTRPCLQYQIKRCSAPCCAYIEPEVYQEDIKASMLFLEGKNQALIDSMVTNMDAYAEAEAYEEAAKIRDQIADLRRTQEQQRVTRSQGDIDVIVISCKHTLACIEVMSIRSGLMLGGRAYFPEVPQNASPDEILSAFIAQFYLLNPHPLPQQIIVNARLPDKQWLEAALKYHKNTNVKIYFAQKGERSQWVQLARKNADEAIRQKLSSVGDLNKRFQALNAWLPYEQTIGTIACVDISHTSGEKTLGAVVVFDMEGPVKMAYRKFNIENVGPGDDYRAIEQTLTRYFTKLKGRTEALLPDLLLIDGGKGQLSAASTVLDNLDTQKVALLAISKGPERKPGKEKFWWLGKDKSLPTPEPLAFQLLAEIRDNAHRFAITGHRQRLAKSRKTSPLEQIEGVGVKRRQQLMKQLGGWQGVSKASVEALARVPGISYALAKRIYNVVHGAKG